MSANEYKVKLEVFEGPLDLLLYLIKMDEVDIYDISIERITQQYLEFMEAFKVLDLEVAGEFVVMAANLIYIKSRSLLPAHVQPPEEEAEEDDPRWDLIRQLVEYKKFKDAAAQLSQRELEQSNLFTRLPDAPEHMAERPLGEVSVFDLINAFNKVLKRIEARSEDLREIFAENFTVSDKIDLIMKLTGVRCAAEVHGTVCRCRVTHGSGGDIPGAARTGAFETAATDAGRGVWGNRIAQGVIAGKIGTEHDFENCC
jgi:segregation and condensation protein A